MVTLPSAALIGATPIAFVSVEALLVLGAVVAGAGVVITAAIAFRASRRRGSSDEDEVRRAPSPASLGMADDPIVAALVGPEADRRSRPDRGSDRSEP